jgi:CDP-6-deoxy-D-xylo-4-hexulose-3-dehydrase
VWTGNATRQPMMAGKLFRVPPSGLPKSDRIMEAGVVLPCNHGMGDMHINFVIDRLQAFLGGAR